MDYGRYDGCIPAYAGDDDMAYALLSTIFPIFGLLRLTVDRINSII